MNTRRAPDGGYSQLYQSVGEDNHYPWLVNEILLPPAGEMGLT